MAEVYQERLHAVEKRERAAEKRERILTKIERRQTKVSRTREKLDIEDEAKALVQQRAQVDEIMQKCGDDEANCRCQDVDTNDRSFVLRYCLALRKWDRKRLASDEAEKQQYIADAKEAEAYQEQLRALKCVFQDVEVEAAALKKQRPQVDKIMKISRDDDDEDHKDLVFVARHFIAYRKMKIKEAAADTALQQLSAEADAEAEAEAEADTFFSNYKYIK